MWKPAKNYRKVWSNCFNLIHFCLLLHIQKPKYAYRSLVLNVPFAVRGGPRSWDAYNWAPNTAPLGHIFNFISPILLLLSCGKRW